MMFLGDGMAMPALTRFVRPDVPLLSSDSEDEEGGGGLMGGLLLGAAGPVSVWPRAAAAAPSVAFLPPRSALERASYETNKSLTGGGSAGGSAPRRGLLRLGFFGL
jgi:hypothetical protein